MERRSKRCVAIERQNMEVSIKERITGILQCIEE
jgi:hypothetical protein